MEKVIIPINIKGIDYKLLDEFNNICDIYNNATIIRIEPPYIFPCSYKITNGCLKDAGFTLQELIDDGYIKKIKNAGFKAMQIVEEVRGNTGELLKDAGFTLQELQEEGLTDTFYNERRIRERLKTREKIGGREKF